MFWEGRHYVNGCSSMTCPTTLLDRRQCMLSQQSFYHRAYLTIFGRDNDIPTISPTINESNIKITIISMPMCYLLSPFGKLDWNNKERINSSHEHLPQSLSHWYFRIIKVFTWKLLVSFCVTQSIYSVSLFVNVIYCELI